MKRFVLAVVLISLIVHPSASAKEKLAVLPLGGNGVETSTLQTVHLLLISEITRLATYEVIADREIATALGPATCTEADCAVAIGSQVGASKVLYGSLNRLGEKIIFQYYLVDVSAAEILLADDLNALTVEDLDLVTKRVAASVVRQVPSGKTVEVGRVTEQESLENKSRKAYSSWGIGFGYLYPEHGHDNQDNVFVWDFRSLYETRSVTVDALLGFRDGFTLNVALLYLSGRGDFSPYAGAGLGFHAVTHKRYYSSGGYYYDYSYEEETSDGFEVLLKTGVIAFRTYDFRVVATAEYGITFNDKHDRAFYITIGVMRAGKRVFGIF